MQDRERRRKEDYDYTTHNSTESLVLSHLVVFVWWSPFVRIHNGGSTGGVRRNITENVKRANKKKERKKERKKKDGWLSWMREGRYTQQNNERR